MTGKLQGSESPSSLGGRALSSGKEGLFPGVEEGLWPSGSSSQRSGAQWNLRKKNLVANGEEDSWFFEILGMEGLQV